MLAQRKLASAVATMSTAIALVSHAFFAEPAAARSIARLDEEAVPWPCPAMFPFGETYTLSYWNSRLNTAQFFVFVAGVGTFSPKYGVLVDEGYYYFGDIGSQDGKAILENARIEVACEKVIDRSAPGGFTIRVKQTGQGLEGKILYLREEEEEETEMCSVLDPTAPGGKNCEEGATTGGGDPAMYRTCVYRVLYNDVTGEVYSVTLQYCFYH